MNDELKARRELKAVDLNETTTVQQEVDAKYKVNCGNAKEALELFINSKDSADTFVLPIIDVMRKVWAQGGAYEDDSIRLRIEVTYIPRMSDYGK